MPHRAVNPSPWLIANNAVLMLACAAVGSVVLHAVIDWLLNPFVQRPYPTLAPLLLAALAVMVTISILQFAGTFLDSRPAATLAGLACLALAAMTVVAVPMLLTGPQLPAGTLAAVAAYAALCAALNLHRGRALSAPPVDTLCPTCGYDCRATPARCPECGTQTPLG